ncbi:MAG TPA: pantoate--beta-alanine ligase [Solirubrobacteraceae bacterium]|nr:pantoate--beta-alanine ligase [Solirubrobacteraceae bacterium]
MRTLRTVAELRTALAPARAGGLSIGLVPTMGALHDGHLALLARAREECDLVVVTLFVNPSQFNELSDLDRYPRDERRDAGLAAEAGADVLFAPAPGEVYPEGFATTVEVAGVSEPLEGASRGAGHFRGVATVVTKLLCMTLPDVAYFGQKDAQQLLVIRRLVADLNLAVRIAAVPTVREPDGLALSSRNLLLSADERRRALGIPRALGAARERAAAGERSAAVLTGCAGEVLAAHGLEVEYVALVDPDSFTPLTELDADGLLLVAARAGAVRLIDNEIVGPRARQSIHKDEVATAVP